MNGFELFWGRRPTSKRKITNLSFFSAHETPKRSSTEVSDIEETPKQSRQVGCVQDPSAYYVNYVQFLVHKVLDIARERL